MALFHVCAHEDEMFFWKDTDLVLKKGRINMSKLTVNERKGQIMITIQTCTQPIPKSMDNRWDHLDLFESKYKLNL